jgi:hypothetical protein
MSEHEVVDVQSATKGNREAELCPVCNWASLLRHGGTFGHASRAIANRVRVDLGGDLC